MSTQNAFSLTSSERQNRTFSSEFKLKKVREIERGLTTVSQICKAYQVSNVSVYKWLAKYSSMKQKKERLIVESKSDTEMIKRLREELAEAQRKIGEQQILLEFRDKMIDIAEEHYGIDIKKNLSSKPSSGSGKKGKR